MKTIRRTKDKYKYVSDAKWIVTDTKAKYSDLVPNLYDAIAVWFWYHGVPLKYFYWWKFRKRKSNESKRM